MVKATSRALAFIAALLAWLALTWDLSLWNMALGAAASLAVLFLYGGFSELRARQALNPLRYFWFLYYLPVFLYEMVKANLDVAYRVIHPALPINPGLVKIKTELKSDLAKAVLGNSLTLTPGITTVDIQGENLYLHCIDINRAAQKTASRFEKILARVFE
jgi:multicomponent Na+:H+ antiporter subunit E